MLYVGFLEFLSLHQIIDIIIKEIDSEMLAVVKCIDSSSLKEDIENILIFHGVPYDDFHNNVCLSHESLLKALSMKVFTDFDELWLFQNSFPKQDLMYLPKSTSDGSNFSNMIHQEVKNAFQKTNCKVLLADGCGLNYITNDSTIEEILNLSNQESL